MSAIVILPRLRSLLAGSIAISAMVACGGGSASTPGGTGGSGTSSGSGGATTPTAVEPSAATKAVWAAIQGYSSWPTFAENPTPKPSMSHMKMYVEAHYNAVVGTAITNKTVPLPDGAIIVKDNFAMPTDTMPMAVTVMAKQSGKWYWIEAMPNGMVMVDAMGHALEGDVAMCSGCHSAMAPPNNDDVVTHNFTM